MASGLEVFINGGRTATGADAVEWAKRVDGYGVPVILPTSKAGDGAQTGYDLPLIRAIKAAVSAEVVASGGAGKLEHFLEAVQAGATILLAASMFHFGMIRIGELKQYLKEHGVLVGGKQE
jgi:imidazole glycerol-phosphate synthase subunit HisF